MVKDGGDSTGKDQIRPIYAVLINTARLEPRPTSTPSIGCQDMYQDTGGRHGLSVRGMHASFHRLTHVGGLFSSGGECVSIPMNSAAVNVEGLIRHLLW